MAHTFTTTMGALTNLEKNDSAQENTTTHLGPFERVDQTALADVGEPTMPTVTLCAALGLYALRRRSNAGAVPDARFVR
jgi:hypothetical protein